MGTWFVTGVSCGHVPLALGSFGFDSGGDLGPTGGYMDMTTSCLRWVGAIDTMGGL